MKSYSRSTVHLDRNEDTRPRHADSGLLTFENDDYASLGFPAQTRILATAVAYLDNEVRAVSDGVRFWLGEITFFDCSHIRIHHLGASTVLPTEGLIFLKIHRLVENGMN